MTDTPNSGTAPLTELVFDTSTRREAEDLYPLWALARDETPVFFNDRLDAWVVTRHEDARAVLKDPQRFVSRDSFDPAIPLPPAVEAVLSQGWANYIVVNIDRPEHTPLRKAVNRVLTRSAVEETTPIIRRIANELVDGFVSDARVDIATDFARLLPALVIGAILGIPKDEVPGMIRWGHDFQTILAGTGSEDVLLRAAHGLVEYQQYFVRAIESRREHPLDDFVSAVTREFDADPALDLTTEQIANIPLALFTAGHNTTSAAICNGLFLLLKHPASLAAVKADPDLIPGAVEEILRYEPPFPFARRTVTEDVVIAGTRITKGSTVMLALASANADSCTFAHDAAAFDIRRDDADQHLTFGYAVHYCPGSPLARREVAIGLEVLIGRLPKLRLVSHERPASFLARGFVRLEVEWDA